ncbi:MAG TPA: hypothetical protein VFH07_16550 [Chitinophagaceae bacterium]|nr:hypothetical protein [Chitinophagaceae bacterium]
MNQYSNLTTSMASKFYLLLIATLSIILLYSCKAPTVLLANFKNDNIGSPPGPTQPTGTVSLNPGSGLITVVAAPIASLPSNKWALISHPAQPAAETTLTGRFTQSGPGKYGLLCSMHIPSNAGVVTVQFEAASPLGSFMHLDFMTEGDLRIDDDNALRFGQFPRDKNFVLSVKLEITASSATVEFSLLGDGASGNKIVNVKPVFLNVAKQFGAVKFWVGFQHNASFFVDDIVVTRKN